MKIIDFNYMQKLAQIDQLLNPETIYDWCNEVWEMKDRCVLPAKQRMWSGSGRYITMPCVIPELDVAGVKFISRNVDDLNGIPARNSNIMLQKPSKMGLIAIEDGIWITNMRTGAIAAHSVICYGNAGMKTMGMMGLGSAAWAFMYIFGHMYDKHIHVKLLKHKDQAERFIQRFQEEFPHISFEVVTDTAEICSCDAVVSAVGYARDQIAKDDVFKKGCVVVPIHTAGFQNCDLCFDKVFIDDHSHAKGYKYYEQFRDKATEICDIVTGKKPGRTSDEERIIVYCGGIALHDIYFAYKIYQIACDRGDCPDIEMQVPDSHLWV